MINASSIAEVKEKMQASIKDAEIEIENAVNKIYESKQRIEKANVTLSKLEKMKKEQESCETCETCRFKEQPSNEPGGGHT